MDRTQRFLLPPDMREWLPADHEVLFVIDMVAVLDLREFEAAYRLGGVGRRAYHPRMMVALLLYAYAVGLESSRAIERACRESVAFRVVCANQPPDHTAIARFRATHQEALKALFVQALRLCVEAGLVRLGLVAVDGTKISANAAMGANRSPEAIAEEIAQWMETHRANDDADDARLGDARGDELPPEMADPKGRAEKLQRLQHAARRAEGMTARRVHPERGSVQANVTDPDSARVKEASGGIIQGYNAQVAVGEGQLILATDVTNDPTDYDQLEPMLEAVDENLEAAGVEDAPEAVVTDAGYASEDNLVQPEEGPERVIGTRNRRKGPGEDPEEVRAAHEKARREHEDTLAHMDEEDRRERERRAAVFERVKARQLTFAQAAAELRMGMGPTHTAYHRWLQGGVDAIPVRRRRRPKPPKPPSRFQELRWAMEEKLAQPHNQDRYRQRAPLVEGTISQLKRRGDVWRFRRRGLAAVRSEWAMRATVHNLRKLRATGRDRWTKVVAAAG